MPGNEFGLGGQPGAVAVAARGDIVANLFAQRLVRGRSAVTLDPAAGDELAAITLRWISFVPSPTIISGASRK